MTTLTENSSQREDITKLNNDYTNYLHKMANSCFKISKKVSNKRAGKNKPWFNWNCKTAKRQTTATVPFLEQTTTILRNFMKL